MARLEALLDHSGQPLLLVESDSSSEVARVSGFVRGGRLSSLVVVGFGQPSFREEVVRAAESAGIPKFAIQRVPLDIYAERRDVSLTKTWALAVATHAAKAAAARYATMAKRVFTQTTSFDRRRLLMSLRQGLAEPVGDPIVLEVGCLPLHKGCRHCSDACGHSAVGHEGRVVEIIHDRCVGCGACAAACPAGALQLPTFSDDEYMALLREFGRRSALFANPMLVFTCDRGIHALEVEAASRMGLGEGVVAVEVPCVAAVGWIHRVWSAAGDVAAMSVCPGGDCPSLADAILAQESALAAVEVLEGDNRSLVAHRTLRAQERVSDACAAVRTQAIRRRDGGCYALGQRRSAILALPPSLFSPSPVHSRALNTFEIGVNEKCTMCGMCSTVCPQKALRQESGSGGLELRFFPSLCTGCQICCLECHERAIGISKAFSPAWLKVEGYVVAARDLVEHCRKCNKEIGSSLNLKKTHELLLRQGNRELAETVYLCEGCKRANLSRW